MLHITNGDSAAETIAVTGLGGAVLPWRDVLHEGPLPEGFDLDQLREVRARFLAERGWTPYADAVAQLARRDDVLASSPEHEEVVLWFEHDLYDQLQLLQVLDWFAGRTVEPTRLTLICIDAFPGVEPFFGLGQLAANQMASLFPRRQPVSREQLDLARTAWTAVRSTDPSVIVRVLDNDIASLPFLRPALMRLLEEYPGVRDGLSRTERQALDVLRAGVRTPAELFRLVAEREERPFMGDDSFWDRLRSVAEVTRPLLTPVSREESTSFLKQPLSLTADGLDVIDGAADHVLLNGLDRWIGGVHLSGREVGWRWDAEATPGRLVRVA